MDLQERLFMAIDNLIRRYKLNEIIALLISNLSKLFFHPTSCLGF